MRIYLAIPYSFNPKMSFDIANRVAADLMAMGHVVFSPISHSHPIADHMDEALRLDHDFWMRADLPLVEWADEVRVVVIGEYGLDLIEKSKGVKREMQYAKELGKPVKFIKCDY